MPHASDVSFRVLHALRVKGFATVDAVVELSGVDAARVATELEALKVAEHALFREARKLWQITPKGKEHHAGLLAADMAAAGAAREGLEGVYPTFLGINEAFKALCGDWQLRGGQPNDHSDATYDAAVIGRLKDLDAQARPVLAAFADAIDRFAGYGPRLAEVLVRIEGGDNRLFTGVMCGSYHDVWMELHEDLILSLGIDRHAEGSF
jgi:hypothetical protein